MSLLDSFFCGTTSTGSDGQEYRNDYGVLTSGFRPNTQMEDSETNITGTDIHSMVSKYRSTGASEGQVTDFIGRLKKKYNC